MDQDHPIRILIADDHALFREGLRFMLQDLSDAVDMTEAETLDDVEITLGNGRGVDIVLLDLHMPGMRGITTLAGLKEEFPTPQYVVLSASEDRADVRQALRCGAKGYIPKSSSRNVMVNALRLVLSGGTYIPPFLLETDGSEATGMPIQATAAGADGLTPRQNQVLDCLAEGKSNKEIARELGLAEGTVKIHIAGILKALKVNNRTQAVIAAGKLRHPDG